MRRNKVEETSPWFLSGNRKLRAGFEERDGGADLQVSYQGRSDMRVGSKQTQLLLTSSDSPMASIAAEAASRTQAPPVWSMANVV